MLFMEYQPHPLLEEIIDCYWIKRSGIPTPADNREHLITDLSMELIMNYGSPLICEHSSARCEIAAGCHLIGMRKQAVVMRHTGPIEIIAVRFRPGGFTRLFSLPAVNFTDRIAGAEQFRDAGAGELSDQLYRLESDQARIARLDEFFLQWFDHGGPSSIYRDHQLLQSAIRRIYQTEGTVPIHSICEELSTGYKKFQRLFQLHIGITPKLFCRIVRFHSAMNKLEGSSSTSDWDEGGQRHRSITSTSTPMINPHRDEWGETEGGVAVEDPYYDQSHYIKEFQHFAGMTPGQLLVNREKLATQLSNSKRLSKFYNTERTLQSMMNSKTLTNKEMSRMEKLTPYIFCEDARQQAEFYAKALGGEIAGIQTFGEMPNATEETKDKVMHLVLKFGELQLFMADYSPLQAGNQIDLAVEFKTEEEARSAFDGISKGGKVIFPLEKMAWGTMLGRVEDPFGIRWQIATVG